VCGQLVNSIPELDAKLYASTQVVDEGRHVEVFERYVKKLHKIYPVDPLLKAQLSVPGESYAAAQAAGARLGADRAALPGARPARLISP